VNGQAAEFFKGERGLRQGYPLSPSLYILMVDCLSRKLEEERRKGNLEGIKIVRGLKSLNHSQFLDDTLLLGGASSIIATRFKVVMGSFLEATRGRINKYMSKIYS